MSLIIEETRDVKKVKEILNSLNVLKEEPNYKEWVENPDNLFLCDDKDNLSVFEGPGICYEVHVFFKTARGKEALALAKEMLDYAFNKHNIQILKGLTPLKFKAALLFSSKMGFKDYGTCETRYGPCRISILTKEEFNKI